MIENLENEIWKDIPLFEGHYEISSLGRIKSHKNGNTVILKGSIDTGGYNFFMFYKDGQPKRIRTHRFVASLFIENNMNLPQVNHLNGIKTDNRVENLEWCSAQRNAKHACEMGLNPPNNGEKNGMCKMTKEKVLEIRNLYPKYTQTELAVMYGVHFSNIGYIVNRKTWKHI